MFKSAAGIRITEVPYKGAGPSLIALMSGEVQLMMAPLGPSVPHVRAGRLKGIAVPSTRRAALFPEIPTIAESGLSGFEAMNWYGVLVPRAVSAPIVAKLNQHIVAVLKSAESQEKIAALGYEPTPSTPREFSLYIQAEIARWAKVIKDAGVPRE
jgi:tripartite-type tricarboxylate transporter receptor subunit TctC